MADGPISASVMIWAVFITAFAMPCLALGALLWRAGHHAAGVKPVRPLRLSAKYRFQLRKPGQASAATPKGQPRTKRAKL